jgi:hypothetical protein
VFEWVNIIDLLYAARKKGDAFNRASARHQDRRCMQSFIDLGEMLAESGGKVINVARLTDAWRRKDVYF